MAAAENNLFIRNVILLRLEDCQRSNGSVLIPTTIEMARIRRPDTGQYRQNVQFSTNMSEQIVQQTLQNSFPTFDLNEGFSCAGINNQSNAFNFHGDRRIWDGSTIRRNIRGNSVLYIVMSEPPHEYQSWIQYLRDNLHYEVTITPAASPLQGGVPFDVTFIPALDLTVTSGFAKFKKRGNVFATVQLERSVMFDCLRGFRIPAAPEPGLADVEIESQGRIPLGFTRMFYYPNKRQTRKMVHFEEPDTFRRLCEDMSENFRGANSSSTGRPQTSATFGHAQQVQLLCLLIYTAAKEGAQQFVEMIFSCSAGRIVFDAYKSNSQLPEVIAREHGNLGTARYFENITKRLLKESSTGKECPKAIDWSELAKATDRTQQQLDLSNKMKRIVMTENSDESNNSTTVETSSSKLLASKSLESEEAAGTKFEVQEDIQTTLGAIEKKWDAMVCNKKDMKIVRGDLFELEMEQDRKDLEEIQIKMMEMNSKFLDNANSLRDAAKKLDQVWEDCKKARYVSTGAVLGGILMVGGGIASLMTAGAATPFLASGISLVVGGTVANIGTVIYEQIKNSKEIKKAEDLLSKLLTGISEIDEIAQSKLGTKGENNLLYLRYLAETQELNDPIQKMLSELAEFKRKQAMDAKERLIRQKVTLVPEDFLQTVTKAPSKSNFNARSSKAVSKVQSKSSDIVSLNGNISKIIWDTEMLGSTIRDVVENNGSKAAQILRKKADELEKLALSNEKIMSTRKSSKCKQSSHDLNSERHGFVPYRQFVA